MTKPIRIQRKCTKGWRMPENTVCVSHGCAWGNPFKVGDEGVPDAKTAVRLFAEHLFPYTHHNKPVHGSKMADFLLSQANLDAIKFNLRGKNLACWCKIGDPCHADYLLEIANEVAG